VLHDDASFHFSSCSPALPASLLYVVFNTESRSSMPGCGPAHRPLPRDCGIFSTTVNHSWGSGVLARNAYPGGTR
jgi:hypothetical protein